MVVKSLSRKERKRKKALRYVWVFLGVIILLLAVYTKVFRITSVEVHGAKHTDIYSVQNDVFALTEGYRYLLIPNNNMFMYQKDKIHDLVLKTYPSVETVDMHVDRNKVLHLDIKDRRPLGVWCSTECYFYDNMGVVFKKSFVYTGPLFTAWRQVPEVLVNFLDTVACRNLCVDPIFMDFLKTYKIEKAVVYDEMIELTSADGYMIKAGFEASTTISHVEKIMEKKPGFLNTLEYVDVRFPTKIFYKEKGV